MDNIRKMSVTAATGAKVADAVSEELDAVAWSARMRFPEEDLGSLRLEVANAARRWSDRVLEEEFPSEAADEFDDEPTQPGKRPPPWPSPPVVQFVISNIADEAPARVILGPRGKVVTVDTAARFKEVFGVPPCGSRKITGFGEYVCSQPSGHMGSHTFLPDPWSGVDG